MLFPAESTRPASLSRKAVKASALVTGSDASSAPFETEVARAESAGPMLL